MIKRFFFVFILFMPGVVLSGCTTNPATGEKQFAALMSPQQENQVGAQEHEKIMAQYGTYKDQNIQQYVERVGRKVTEYTERPDVEYKFFVLDSPIVNAFALPGGYIYVSRGLLTLANSEAELAAVLAHETGHITARHSAERYSHSVATTLGSAILSAAIGSSGVSQALGVGSNLYLSSYSRGQESQADTLGLRYLSRAGYGPAAMSSFLSNLQADTALNAKIAGKQNSPASNYFSTHPATVERVHKTVVEAQQYSPQGIINRDTHLRMIDGMVYGDSAAQGFARGQTFYHPNLGFKFTVPDDYEIINQSRQVLAVPQDKSGALIIFDFDSNPDRLSDSQYLKDKWMEGKPVTELEAISVNGRDGVAALIHGQVNGKEMDIRLIAVRWSDTQMARFHIALPAGTSPARMTELKRTSYSFARMTAAEKNKVKPYSVKVITSKAGDSVALLASRMAPEEYKQERFRVLNGLSVQDKIAPNRLYKIVVE